MSHLICLFNGRTHIMSAFNSQKIFSRTGVCCIKQCSGRRIYTDDSACIINKNKRLFHIAGNLLKLILLSFQCMHLKLNFLVLCVNTAKQWRKFFIHLIIHRIFKIKLVERFDHAPCHSVSKICRKANGYNQNNGNRLNHTQHQHKSGCTAYRNTKNASIVQPYSLINGLFCQC